MFITCWFSGLQHITSGKLLTVESLMVLAMPLFPNCSCFHITFTVPTQFRTLLFEKRSLFNAVFSASTGTIISFCKERGFLPAVTAVLHTFGSDLKRLRPHSLHCQCGWIKTYRKGRTIQQVCRTKKEKCLSCRRQSNLG